MKLSQAFEEVLVRWLVPMVIVVTSVLLGLALFFIDATPMVGPTAVLTAAGASDAGTGPSSAVDADPLEHAAGYAVRAPARDAR